MRGVKELGGEEAKRGGEERGRGEEDGRRIGG